MGIISISLPVVGQTNATEDPKIPSALTTIETLVNGSIDTTNLAAAAGILPAQLAAGNARFQYVSAVANQSATDGHLYVCVGGITLTLSAVQDAVVTVVANSLVTGASPVTVATGGGVIYGNGTGATGAASVKLGTASAHLVLYCFNGTDWVVVSGQQDTGWVALTLAVNVATVGGYTPAARILGNRVWFSGGMVNTGSFSAGVTWATLPSSAFRPASTSYLNALSIGSSGVTVDATSATSALNQVGGPATNGTILTLEGTSYRLI